MKTLADRPEEERKEIARKGAYASAEAKRQKKQLIEAFNILLNMPVKPGRAKAIRNIKHLEGIEGVNLPSAELIAAKMVLKALKGDTRAAEFIRDTVDGKPKASIEIDPPPVIIIEGEDDMV